MQNRKNSGFTIIEVVLVLAIAGLIFLVVFVALPQLQASRRDTERRTALQSYFAELERLPAYPTSQAEHDSFVATIESELLVLSAGTLRYELTYRDMAGASHADVPTPEQIFYQVGHRCDSPGGDPIEDADGGHNRGVIAVWIGLERSGHLCLDNS